MECSSVSGFGNFWWNDLIGNITDTLRFFVTSLPPDSNLLFSDEEAVWNSISNWNQFYNRPLNSWDNTSISYPNAQLDTSLDRNNEATLIIENALQMDLIFI